MSAMRISYSAFAFLVAAASLSWAPPSWAVTREGEEEEAPDEPIVYGPSAPGGARYLLGIERFAGVVFSQVRDERAYGSEHYYPKQAVDAVGVWGLGREPGAYALRAPRLAFDMVTGKTTLGLSATIWPSSTSRTGAGDIRSLSTDVLALAFGPRVGWRWCDRERFCFWPKAGVSLAYQHATHTLVGVDTATGTFAQSGTAQDSLVTIDLEPTLIVGIAPHVGVTVQGALDVPLVASRQLSGATAPTSDPSPWTIGAWLTLLVWF
jgi:hypothetical protein